MKHLLLAMLVITVLSCSKSPDEKLPRETNKPKITIIAPATGASYHTGDPLCFKGDVLDDSGLNSVTLKLFNSNDMTKPVVEYYYSVWDRSFYLDKKVLLPAELNGNCILMFEATDAYYNKAVVSMNFSNN